MPVARGVTLAAVLAGAPAWAGLAEVPDRWAPGATDPQWERIAALQAWPAFGAEPSDWDAAVQDPDPVVRAAAAAALGRGHAKDAARRLLPLLGDDSDMVRWTALWALLQAPSDAAREPLLTALASWGQLHRESSPFALAGLGTLLRLAGLPADLTTLRRDERAEWLSRFDRSSWRVAPVPAYAPEFGPALRASLCAVRSEWDADQGTTLEAAFDAAGVPRPVRAELGSFGWRELETSNLTLPDQRRGHPSLRTVDGLATLEVSPPGTQERLRLAGDPAIFPGIYVLQPPSGANPLFFRVRRSRMFERTVPDLLAAAPRDPSAVERLGDMRVKAAAPVLLRLWQAARASAPERLRKRRRVILDGMEQDWEIERPMRALARIESRQAAAGLVPLLMEGTGDDLGSAGYREGLLLEQLGELARPYVEAHVIGWRDVVRRGRRGGLATVVLWPGASPGSPFARAVEEIAEAFLAPGASPRDTGTALAALQALARFNPERAASLIVEALRRPSPDPLLVRARQPDPDRAYEGVLRRVWAAVRDDHAVPSALRSDLAAAAVAYEPPFDGVPIPGDALDGWLVRAVTGYAAPTRIDGTIRVARDGLAREPNAMAEVLLAELERRRGRWEEAIRLAAHALPGLRPDRRAFAHSVLAFAGAATGEADEARRQLAASRASGGWRAGADSLEQEGWTRNIETRPVVPALRIRYELARTVEIAAGGFWAESANRLRFAPQPDGAGDLVAVTSAPARHIVSLGLQRAGLLLADGTVAAYEAGRSTPLWRTEPPSRFERIGGGQGILMAQSEGRVVALDPDDGRELWASPASTLLCELALDNLPGVLVGTTAPGPQVLGLRDRRTGAPVWAVTLAQHAAACASDGVLVAWADASGAVGAAEAATGCPPWMAYPAWDDGASTVPVLAVTPGSAVLGRRGSAIIAFDRGTGRERWRFRWTPPPSSAGPSQPILLAPGTAATWIVAAWRGRDETQDVTLHEVIRIGDGGTVTARAQGPAHPLGRSWWVRAARATPDGIVVSRGMLDEVWTFGGELR